MLLDLSKALHTINHELSEAVVRWCSVKKVFLEISENSQKNTCSRRSFLIKLQARNFAKFKGKHLCQRLSFIKKESLTQVFSCKFCEISKYTFFYRTLPAAASEILIAKLHAYGLKYDSLNMIVFKYDSLQDSS